MKKLALFIMAACVVLAACKKDDNNKSDGNSGENPFVGVWKHSSEGNDPVPYSDTWTIEFKSDHSFLWNSTHIEEGINDSTSGDGTYDYSEMDKTFAMTMRTFGEPNDTTITGTYKFIGNTLILTSKDGPVLSFEKQAPAPSLIGKWKVISYKIANFENTGTTINEFDPTNVEVKENGTCRLDVDMGEGEISTRIIGYTIDGSKINFSEVIAWDTHDSFYFELSGNTLILTRSDNFSNSQGNYTEYTTVTLQRIN